MSSKKEIAYIKMQKNLIKMLKKDPKKQFMSDMYMSFEPEILPGERASNHWMSLCKMIVGNENDYQ